MNAEYATKISQSPFQARALNSQPAKMEKSMSIFSFQQTGLRVGFQSPAVGLHCTHRKTAHSDCVRMQLVVRA